MTSSEQKIIDAALIATKERFSGEESSHDWFHMERVWKMARQLAAIEKADSFIVELAALFHDWADWKMTDNQAEGAKEITDWLASQNVDSDRINKILAIIDKVSFKGLGHDDKQTTIEGQVVQDADRLDAIGAIAIARTFAFCGLKNRPIYDPEIDLKVANDEEYKALNRSGILHFYDKLLHLKDRMNTSSAKKIAESRHQYMEEYLDRFFAEWDGKK